MANKFILTLAVLVLISSVAIAQTALAEECGGSGTTKLITYSPSDLNVEEKFNLTYYDLFGGAGQSVTLNYPAELEIILGNKTVTLIDDGFGGSYFTWHLNSSSPGNHSVYVEIGYEGNCNVTRIIEILPTLQMPHIELNYLINGNATAKQNLPVELVISNTGIGTAYNVNGWTDFINTIDTFSFSTINPENNATRNLNINTAVCGETPLESTVNYEDNFGYQYQPSHTSTILNVVGSDLEIKEFKISKSNPRKGQTIEFTVKLSNKERNTTIEASNVIVQIYRENDLIKEIEFDNIKADSTATETATWKVSGDVGDVEMTAVVDSDNECSNWGNTKTKTIEIKKERDDKKSPFRPKEDENKTSGDYYNFTSTDSGDEDDDANLGWIIYLILGAEILLLILVLIYLVKKRH